MNRDGRSSSNDPTAEPAVHQSTPGSGVSGRRERPDAERNRALGDDVTQDDLATPRRYDQPLTEDEDPVMPSDDATVNTKI